MGDEESEDISDAGCVILFAIGAVSLAITACGIASCEKAVETARYQYQTEIEKAKIERGIKP